jgi:hypothetical protein
LRFFKSPFFVLLFLRFRHSQINAHGASPHEVRLAMIRRADVGGLSTRRPGGSIPSARPGGGSPLPLSLLFPPFRTYARKARQGASPLSNLSHVLPVGVEEPAERRAGRHARRRSPRPTRREGGPDCAQPKDPATETARLSRSLDQQTVSFNLDHGEDLVRRS